MASFTELKNGNDANIFKALDFALFAKPYDADNLDEIEQIWTESDGLLVPPDYDSIGYTTKTDTSWTRDQNWVETESHGESEPTRRDNTRDVEGLSFTAQESNAVVLALFKDMHLDGITADADGNIRIKKGTRPAGRHWHILGIAKDGDGPDAIYVARWLPRAQVTEMGEQQWSEENELTYPMTITAKTDRTVGSSMVELWGGPGFDAEARGFSVSAP